MAANDRVQAALAAIRGKTPEGEGEESVGNFVSTWDDLARACDITRRWLQTIRNREAKNPKLPRDRADGRKEVKAWKEFLASIGQFQETEDEIDEGKLRLRERRYKVAREEFELAKVQDEHVPKSHVEAALGQMLGGFVAALDALAPRLAQAIEESDHAELFKLFDRAEKEGLSFKQLRKMIAEGKARPFADFHERRRVIDHEIATARRTLAKCEYMEALPDGDEE